MLWPRLLRKIGRINGTRLALICITGLYIALGCMYAVNTPLFESPDESSHLQVIRYIAKERQLPPYQIPDRRADTGPNMAWLIGYHDPPLYYAPPLYHVLAALVTAWDSMDDLVDRLIPSPSWAQGFSPHRGSDAWNKNVFVHLPDETLLASRTVRAVALLRGLSILLGAVTVLCTYAIAREIWPERAWLALGAAAWVALNPQFAASHSGVSNDPLTNALFSVTFLGLLRMLRTGAAWPHWAALGIPVGAGLLTKQSALMLLPLGALGALVSAWVQRPVRFEAGVALKGIGRAMAFGVTAVLLGGGWYLANAIRYGDPLGTLPHWAIQVPLDRFGWQALLAGLQSYWVAFGWALITAPWWLYAAVAVCGVHRDCRHAQGLCAARPGFRLLLGGIPVCQARTGDSGDCDWDELRRVHLLGTEDRLLVWAAALPNCRTCGRAVGVGAVTVAIGLVSTDPGWRSWRGLYCGGAAALVSSASCVPVSLPAEGHARSRHRRS